MKILRSAQGVVIHFVGPHHVLMIIINEGHFLKSNFVIPVFLFFCFHPFSKTIKMAMFLFFVTLLNSFSKTKH